MSIIDVNEHDLPADLRELQLEIEEHARDYGLDFFDTIFEVLDYDELNEIAALRRLPDPLPALAVRHGVRAALQGLSLRAARRSTRW